MEMKGKYIIFGLIISTILLVPSVLAVNLDFTIGVPETVFYPNETIPVNYSIINRDAQFKAKDAKLTLTIGPKNYTYDLGDISKGESLFEELELSEYPPGSHIIRGILTYGWLFNETFTLETYKSISVRFPDIQRIPRGIKIKSINLLAGITEGESTNIVVVVANEGEIAGDLEIVIEAPDTSVSKDFRLEPGETKNVELTATFRNPGSSLIEAKVYTTIEGERYILAYSGKVTFVKEHPIEINTSWDEGIVNENEEVTTETEECKHECCSDADCGSGKTCSPTVFKCVEKSECISVINNGNPSTKADVVFVGDGYFDYEELENDILKLVDYSGNNQYNGLMSVEPFKSNKNKFNIWTVKTDNIPYSSKTTYFKTLDNSYAAKIAAKCTHSDYQVIISKKEFRSYCYFGSPCFVSIGDSVDNCEVFPGCDGRVLLHEFGHGFGLLADEYIEEALGNRPIPPNCAPEINTAKKWWGDLITQNNNIGYYQGCSYTEGNIRPTKNSIMRSPWSLEDTFYAVNEKKLREVLNKYQ